MYDQSRPETAFVLLQALSIVMGLVMRMTEVTR